MLRLPSAPRLFVPGFLKPVVQRRLHVLHANIWHVGPRGDILWVGDGPTDNLLHDEGEQAILSSYFDTDLAGYGPPPASLHLGLDNRTTLAEADTLASLVGEPTLGGYARKAISTTTGFTLSQPGAYYLAAIATQSFIPSGADYGDLRNCFLATTADGTGKIVCSIPFEIMRTVKAGDTLNIGLSVGLSE